MVRKCKLADELTELTASTDSSWDIYPGQGENILKLLLSRVSQRKFIKEYQVKFIK